MPVNLQEKDGLQEDGDPELRLKAQVWLDREFDDCSVHAVGKIIKDSDEKEAKSKSVKEKK
ncbi:hypothetical protein KAU19_03435 [Candidatus Parcubacteria bacterium]|nr:hypothetical protein [Candidatus Parcubacteria bacterium]